LHGVFAVSTPSFAKQAEASEKKRGRQPRSDGGQQIGDAARIGEGQQGETGERRSRDDCNVRFNGCSVPD
jgi:hypothetical protein